MSLSFKQVVKAETHAYKKKALTNGLYLSAMHLRSVFVDIEFYRTHSTQWRILLDYIALAEAGCDTDGQRRIVRTYLIEFGEGSEFHTNFKTQKRLRERWRQRVLFMFRVFREFRHTPEWTKVKNKTKFNRLNLLLIKFSRKLWSEMLTAKEQRKVYELEHFLGIWWDDLPDSENGLLRKSLKTEE